MKNPTRRAGEGKNAWSMTHARCFPQYIFSRINPWRPRPRFLGKVDDRRRNSKNITHMPWPRYETYRVPRGQIVFVWEKHMRKGLLLPIIFWALKKKVLSGTREKKSSKRWEEEDDIHLHPHFMLQGWKGRWKWKGLFLFFANSSSRFFFFFWRRQFTPGCILWRKGLFFAPDIAVFEWEKGPFLVDFYYKKTAGNKHFHCDRGMHDKNCFLELIRRCVCLADADNQLVTASFSCFSLWGNSPFSAAAAGGPYVRDSGGEEEKNTIRHTTMAKKFVKSYLKHLIPLFAKSRNCNFLNCEFEHGRMLDF